MYQVFNMGHRLECYTPSLDAALSMISIAASFGIEAKIIGKVVTSETAKIIIKTEKEEIVYDY